MMTENIRREIARKYLLRNFGKYGDGSTTPFTLRRIPESAYRGQARAFTVLNAPYNSTSSRRVIVVSDNFDELERVAKKVFDKDRYDNDKPEFREAREGAYVMFD